jgi:hypothetical protein
MLLIGERVMRLAHGLEIDVAATATAACREIHQIERTERSQEITENKGEHFSHRVESQEVYENRGLIFVKPRGC